MSIKQPPLRIVPSLLSCDFSRIQEEICAVEEGGADWLHLDIMDGHFVPNITFGPPVLRSIRAVTECVLDVHLMIAEPDRYLESFAEAGADIITVHAETCTHLQRTLATIRSLGKKAGVALNPHTSEDVLRYLFDDLDLILIMTVNPGFGGQAFLPKMLPKIEAIRWMVEASGKRIELAVDGGVSARNAQELRLAGANLLVAGAAVFGSSNYGESIRAIREAAR